MNSDSTNNPEGKGALNLKLSQTLDATDGQARATTITIKGIEVKTPLFMPVGTNGTVKAMTTKEVQEIGYPIILGNTYHLFLRPGDELIRDLGGLHKFMNWDQLILTDSGGFQVFSLAKMNKVTEEGAFFQSHIDGSKHLLSPEKSIQIQENLGSNIMMVLDECLPIPSARRDVEKSVELTTRWAKRSLEARTSQNNLFAIVQGTEFLDLRKRSAESLMEMDFDGFAIGGLSVGESKEIMRHITEQITPLLPKEKPRYLMGVGEPVDLLESVGHGIDMFDCVMPTRNARNGCLFTKDGKLMIKQSRFRRDPKPLEEDCGCEVCQNYSRGYLSHLYRINEILAARLHTYHNLYFFQWLMDEARTAILEGRYQSFKADFIQRYQAGNVQ